MNSQPLGAVTPCCDDTLNHGKNFYRDVVDQDADPPEEPGRPHDRSFRPSGSFRPSALPRGAAPRGRADGRKERSETFPALYDSQAEAWRVRELQAAQLQALLPEGYYGEHEDHPDWSIERPPTPPRRPSGSRQSHQGSVLDLQSHRSSSIGSSFRSERATTQGATPRFSPVVDGLGGEAEQPPLLPTTVVSFCLDEQILRLSAATGVIGHDQDHVFMHQQQRSNFPPIPREGGYFTDDNEDFIETLSLDEDSQGVQNRRALERICDDFVHQLQRAELLSCGARDDHDMSVAHVLDVVVPPVGVVLRPLGRGGPVHERFSVFRPCESSGVAFAGEGRPSTSASSVLSSSTIVERQTLRIVDLLQKETARLFGAQSVVVSRFIDIRELVEKTTVFKRARSSIFWDEDEGDRAGASSGEDVEEKISSATSSMGRFGGAFFDKNFFEDDFLQRTEESCDTANLRTYSSGVAAGVGLSAAARRRSSAERVTSVVRRRRPKRLSVTRTRKENPRHPASAFGRTQPNAAAPTLIAGCAHITAPPRRGGGTLSVGTTASGTLDSTSSLVSGVVSAGDEDQCILQYRDVGTNCVEQRCEDVEEILEDLLERWCEDVQEILEGERQRRAALATAHGVVENPVGGRKFGDMMLYWNFFAN